MFLICAEFAFRFAPRLEKNSLSSDALLQLLSNADADIYTNGVTDLIIVDLTAFVKPDVMIGNVNEALSNSQSSFVASFVSLASTTSNAGVKNSTEKRQSTPDIETLTFLPTPVIEGMMVGFIILIIFFSGACCLLQIQTPERFDLGKNIVAGN